MNPDYRRYVDNEYKDHRVYMALAGVERNGPRRKTLEKLADVEGRHYRFWLLHIPGHKPSVSGAYIRLMVLLRMLFGVTFVVKLLESHEKKTLEQYKQLVLDEAFDNNSRDALNKIIEEEGEIEKKLVSSIDEAVVRYLGFMMLGVADAIVELTGVQAGFLGVTDSPLVAGIAGLIVGVAAAISMGAASYLQARQGMSEKTRRIGSCDGAAIHVNSNRPSITLLHHQGHLHSLHISHNSCSPTHSPPNLLHISNTGKKLPQRVFAERLDTIGCRFWHILSRKAVGSLLRGRVAARNQPSPQNLRRHRRKACVGLFHAPSLHIKKSSAELPM
jgi:VIT1/CCC1 family predicted Fe2+/Mn2+ transporter